MGYRGHTVVDVDAHYTDSIEDVVAYLDDDDPWKRRMRSDDTAVLNRCKSLDFTA